MAATVFLCGDVMTGRGVDQILPHPGDPALREDYVRDARRYADLVEARSGAIRRPVDYGWPWGDALDVLRDLAPDARMINLESSITQCGDFAPGKPVHYRMHPDNVPCLAAASPDVSVLANNHVLDFGQQGLADTLDALAGAGLRTAGAGRDLAAAQAPAIVPLGDGRRLVVVACALASSGVPPDWAAAGGRAGVDLLPDLSDATAAAVTARIDAVRRIGDLAVVSLHWGSNWGYDVPPEHRHFAHRLVAGGVDVVHGHSSHHVRPVEVHRGALVLYGCGDFIDDYEGVTGYEQYRDDLRPMYFATFDRTGLAGLRIVTLQAHRMRLRHPSGDDLAGFTATLDRISRPFGTRAALDADAMVDVRAA